MVGRLLDELLIAILTTHQSPTLRSFPPPNMSSAVLARVARASLYNTQACRVRPVRAFQAAQLKPATAAFSSASRRMAGDPDPHDPHHEESFEEFTARYVSARASYSADRNGSRQEGAQTASIPPITTWRIPGTLP